MKICVIGGTGHIGSFLVPLLSKDGNEIIVVVTCRTPIPWKTENKVTIQMGRYVRDNAEWYNFIKEINAEIIIDILGIDLPSTYNAVKVFCKHFIACGSLWMYGPPKMVPTPEVTQGSCEYEAYKIRYAEIISVMEQVKRDGIAGTAIMPPNICGPGKIPLEGRGGRVIAVHKSHHDGEVVYLPEGCKTLLGPCDASDVAMGFYLAVQNRGKSGGEIFNVGSAYSLTAQRFIETYGEIYKIPIPIQPVSWNEFMKNILPNKTTNYHFREHMCPDITKIQKTLGYNPQYTPEESMERAVQWMRKESLI